MCSPQWTVKLSHNHVSTPKHLTRVWVKFLESLCKKIFKAYLEGQWVKAHFQHMDDKGEHHWNIFHHFPFMPQIMILSCCLCNLARAAGQSTACPKLYNLQTLGKLGTGASNPELWGCDDSEDAKTMRSRWKNTHLRPSWMIYHVCPFELSTISICSQHWCQCHSLCDHRIPVPVDLLAAKCLSTLPRPFLHPTHVRHLGRVAWWFGWCSTLCGAWCLVILEIPWLVLSQA